MTHRSVLEELSGADWCICEDADLDLQVIDKGLSAYHQDRYGEGLIIDLKKQRFR